MTEVVYRVEVRPHPSSGDARGDAACRQVASSSPDCVPKKINTASVFLVQGVLSTVQMQQIADELLADPVTEVATLYAPGEAANEQHHNGDQAGLVSEIEVHPLPGVMDPAAQAVELAITSLLGQGVSVRTGRRFELVGMSNEQAHAIAIRCLANPVIHAVHDHRYHPATFAAGAPYELEVKDVAITSLDDQALMSLSREAHLFLSLDEMKAIQIAYKSRGVEPREIELETLAQTWSEHCVHKTLKSRVRYVGSMPGTANRPGHTIDSDGAIIIDNLLKSTVAAATYELIEEGIDWCLSVFVDNAGIIAFDEEHGVCFKVETHNHPSAIEPYGGAATGIGGCIRDIIGTGLAAKPIAATDVFCVAPPDTKEVPTGCLPPRRILEQVVSGVRDYGNRMGIPTLNGTVWFDPNYVGNPLVFCGCVGVMPRDRCDGDSQPGDHIIALGGRTGRDGIHGATFSSAELTDSHADEFSHAVQIGNPVTEKQVLDAILEARDNPVEQGGCLFSAITDCGAGGFSSAVGEMGEQIGASVQLERAPLKYDGLTPTEIWISEAQERMVMAVPKCHLKRLQEICDENDVEMCDLGTFGTPGRELILRYYDTEVGRIPMQLLHEGIPNTVRDASWLPSESPGDGGQPRRIEDLGSDLLELLGDLNVASKQWIIRQYDHEVQGRSVIKPLVGPDGQGPSDAAVIRPVAGSDRGLAIANGLAVGWSAEPYLMALAGIDECVRNLVCVGADPSRIAILDNFCWPSCDAPETMGSLVQAAWGCYDAAKAYATPFISGKDSLHNQFTTEDGQTIRIPSTLLISGFSPVNDVATCVTMDAKSAGHLLILVGQTTPQMGGSRAAAKWPEAWADRSLPAVDLEQGPVLAHAVAGLIARGCVCSAHDCSDGGLLVAAAEMAFSGHVGLSLDADVLQVVGGNSLGEVCFSETPSRYLLEVAPDDLASIETHLGDLPWAVVGMFDKASTLRVSGTDLNIELTELRDAWLAPLGW